MAKAVGGIPLIQDFTSPSRGSVESAFQRLSKTAIKLNDASDELTTLVTRLDLSLKKLNLGVSAWVDIEYDQNNDDMSYHRECLGYTKWGKKWGVVITVADGDLGDDPHNAERDGWLFLDAPRELRIKAVEKIPELIEALDKAANSLATNLVSRVGEVAVLASAIEGQTGGAE